MILKGRLSGAKNLTGTTWLGKLERRGGCLGCRSRVSWRIREGLTKVLLEIRCRILGGTLVRGTPLLSIDLTVEIRSLVKMSSRNL